MVHSEEQQQWAKWRDQELAVITNIVEAAGFVLDDSQPHLIGERFLMQAMTTTGGKKLILLGKRVEDNQPVVIKGTSDKAGIRELEHERTCRRLLHEIEFAYDTFHSPAELTHLKEGEHVISIQSFIEQEKPFLDRPLEEQFEFSLRAFKAQECAHAATARHIAKVRGTFGVRSTEEYLASFAGFLETCTQHGLSDQIHVNLKAVQQTLQQEQRTIEQYGGFLTHTDFVPHNFRIKNDVMYLLDFSSLRFGNKHEGWARFLNFMTLYHSQLEQALLQYMRDNRAPEEQHSLHLMRLYRLGEIITYYLGATKKSTGDLQKLNQLRIELWNHVLQAQLQGQPADQTYIADFKVKREQLRSEDEKRRQRGLH